jgi:hypothetical protein
MGAYSWNEDFNSETTACAESTIAELYNRVGDGCAVRLWTNSLSRLAYPRMPQRLLRKGGTAPHSCRVLRFQRMANYTDDRLADWNGRHAFPSTREAKGQQMTPKRPRDPNQLAKSIIDIADGEKPDRDPRQKSR